MDRERDHVDETMLNPVVQGRSVGPHPVNIGGLLRCCVQTARGADPDVYADGLVQCPHCKEWMVWRDGAWQWDSGHAGA